MKKKIKTEEKPTKGKGICLNKTSLKKNRKLVIFVLLCQRDIEIKRNTKKDFRKTTKEHQN